MWGWEVHLGTDWNRLSQLHICQRSMGSRPPPYDEIALCEQFYTMLFFVCVLHDQN